MKWNAASKSINVIQYVKTSILASIKSKLLLSGQKTEFDFICDFGNDKIKKRNQFEHKVKKKKKMFWTYCLTKVLEMVT